MGGAKENPLVGFHFALEIGGKVSGFFTEVGGVGSENEVIEHKVVGAKGIQEVKKIPGRLKWTDITLKRGITSSMDMYEWRKMVEDGHVAKARTNGSIMMLDQELKLVAQWDFTAGWPSKVSGPALQADSNAYGVEEMVIVHEGIKRIK